MDATGSGRHTDHRLQMLEGRLHDFADAPVACMRRVQEQAGNLVALRQDDQQIVFAFGAELNRQVLARSDRFHSRFFAIRGPKYSAQRRLTSGLLSMNGKEHAAQRRIVRAAFEKRVIPGYTQMVQHHTHGMLSEWKAGQRRDIAREMTALLLKVTSSMLFGLQEHDLAFDIGHRMDQWVQLNHELGIGALVPDEHFYSRYEHLLSFAEELEDRVREMIRQRASSQTSADEPGTDVISLLLKARADGQRITEEQLIGQVALLFAAAHMTTAHTLSWTLFLLAQHPHIMQEVIDWQKTHGPTVEHEQNGRPAVSRPPAAEREIGVAGSTTPDALDRIIRESMRILPASAYSQRVTSGTAELNGNPLPSGTLVIFSQFMTHRNARVFPASDEFRPDRWQTARPSAYEYLPFGGGSRLCLGGPLALSILRTVIPMVLSHCSLQMEPNAEVNARVISTMLSPTTAIPMRLLPPGTIAAPSPVDGNIHDLVALPQPVNIRAVA